MFLPFFAQQKTWLFEATSLADHLMSLVDTGKLIIGEGNEFIGQVLAFKLVGVKIRRPSPIGRLNLLILLLRIRPRTIFGIKREDKSESGMPI